MTQVFIPRLEAAIAELRDRPITGTDKGFGVAAPGATVSAASLGAARPSLFGPGFTMPVLVLREPAVAHNIGAMAAYCAAAGVRFAPHGKTTMAPQLFARQLAAGAWAVTAATVGELQVYRAFGIPRVLLANELTDPAGAAWLAGELAADPGFDCYVYADSLPGVRLLDEAVRQASPARPLPVLVELGYPGGRTGCRGLAAAEEVARAVARAGSLRLAGAAGYEGLIGHDRSPQTVSKITAYCRDLRSLGERLAADLAPDELILSAGGSAFFDIVVRELASVRAGQPAPEVVLRSGVYIAFDHGLYAGMVPSSALALEPALELWAHVLSRPEPGLALACAGGMWRSTPACRCRCGSGAGMGHCGRPSACGRSGSMTSTVTSSYRRVPSWGRVRRSASACHTPAPRSTSGGSSPWSTMTTGSWTPFTPSSERLPRSFKGCRAP